MSTTKRLKFWVPVGLIAALGFAAVVYAMVIQGSEGNYVKADSEGHMKVYAVSVPIIHHVNEMEKEVYSWAINLTPGAASAEFVYLKNNSDLELVINKLYFAANTDETISILHTVTGTPVTYTDTEGSNFNAGSANKEDANFYVGENITGLSAGTLINRFVVDGGTGSQSFVLSPEIILPKNATLMMTAKSGSIALTGAVIGYFHED